MRIVVAYQWAPDPQEGVVNPDGSVDFSRAKPSISDYDATAIEVGRLLCESTGAELVGVSVGGAGVAAPVATKAALARGLDRVVVVSDPCLESLGTTGTARALAAAVSSVGDVALVLAGDTSVDNGSRTLPAVLGGALGWPVLTDASRVEVDGSTVTVSRAVAEGVQTLAVTGPAVVAVAADAAKPKAPGMKDVMAAGKKPALVQAPSDLGVAVGPEGVLVSRAPASGQARKGVRIDTADPQAAAAALVAALRSVGALE